MNTYHENSDFESESEEEPDNMPKHIDYAVDTLTKDLLEFEKGYSKYCRY